MKNKTCFKEFIKYSSFNIFGMIGLSCYILADTFFVSTGLGANGLAALNLAIPIYSFINGSGLMFGMGGATKYSILKSQNETYNTKCVFTNTIFITLSLAFIFFVIGILFSEFITEMLGANEVVFKMSKTYLQVIMIFAPIFMLNNVILCFVRNDGAPQLSMIAMIGGSLSNIVLDYIFIFIYKMGILGAALATGLAPIISMTILSIFFLKRKNTFHLTICKLSKQLVVSIFSNGLPSLITEVSSGIVIIIFNSIILNLQGNIGVAAYGVIANLSLVAIAIYTGIAQGIQPLISKNYGIGNITNIKLTLKYALILMLIISLIIYSCVFFGAFQIVSIFNNEHNLLLENIAVIGLKIYFIACMFSGFNIILSVYFTSTEYARPAHIISILRGFLIIIPMAFLLSSLGGIIGVWCVLPVTEIIVSIIGIILYIFAKKRVSKNNN